jgi:hypothetical protein
MLYGANHTRNAHALGEVPMSSTLMTLGDFQAAELPPPSARAPRTDPTRESIANLLKILGKVTLGRIITSSVAVTSWNRDQRTSGSQRQSLSQPPLTARAPEESLRVKIEQFREALRDALELSDTMIADEAGEPIDNQTLIYAIQTLEPLVMSLKLPPPLMLPLQNGGIGAEWHTSGMNIELRFRKPYDVYAVLEDAQGAVPQYHGRDPHLVQAGSALCELSARSAG